MTISSSYVRFVAKDMCHGDKVDGIWAPSIMTRNPHHGYSAKWGPRSESLSWWPHNSNVHSRLWYLEHPRTIVNLVLNYLRFGL